MESVQCELLEIESLEDLFAPNIVYGRIRSVECHREYKRLFHRTPLCRHLKFTSPTIPNDEFYGALARCTQLLSLSLECNDFGLAQGCLAAVRFSNTLTRFDFKAFRASLFSRNAIGLTFVHLTELRLGYSEVEGDRLSRKSFFKMALFDSKTFLHYRDFSVSHFCCFSGNANMMVDSL